MQFLQELEQSPELRSKLERYTQAMINQISQTVACNHVHSIEARACRCLLMCHDRVGTDDIQLTQEFLAGECFLLHPGSVQLRNPCHEPLLPSPTMKWLVPIYRTLYGCVALFFGAAGATIVVFAVQQLLSAIQERQAAAAIDAISLLVVALVALEISQTVVEEEVIRQAHVSAPTRVRRYLSRFLVVIVIALGVETLVSVMKLQETPAHLAYAASVGYAVAALLAGWGAFVWFNRSAEELEPEAMQEAKREDRKLQ